jgi:TonB family protein
VAPENGNMTVYEQKKRRINWKAGLIALFVSLLVHQAIFFALQLAGLFENAIEDKKTEISLIETPPEEKKKEPEPEKIPAIPVPPAPMPKPIPAPKPLPKPAPMPEKPEPPPPEPPSEPQPEPPKPEQMGPPEPDSPATDPKQVTAVPSRINTKMNWGVFERTMGDVAKEELVRYQDESMKKRGGGVQFGALTPKVAKAMQTHKSWVQGAPKEPIDPHAPVFQNYLESTHDQIHTLFADSFLPSLVSLGASHPLNNFNMFTMLEFEILENGVINEVRMLKTSGQSVFDAAAIDSLYRASPFLPPPKSILSWNNRVYFRWGFYRNNRKCGTFNASGYILRAPDAAPVPIDGKQYEMPQTPDPAKFQITDG